jgi:cystathionine gamma-synthase
MSVEPSPPYRPATVAVTSGRPPHDSDNPLNEPLTMASTYVAGGDVEYGRYGNPTWSAFEQALGDLEGGRCLAFSSGLAAVGTILDLVGLGSTVVAPRHAYNGSIMQLADLEARGRLKAVLVDVTETDAVVKACEDAALVWLESPTNPALEVADIPPIVEAAHQAGAYVVVDNTFATPLLQQPLSLGADLVVHSATKFIGGHSDLLLGGVESTFERRRRWKSEPATIPDGLVRMSVGIEDVDDLWSDLAAALDDLTGDPPA